MGRGNGGSKVWGDDMERTLNRLTGILGTLWQADRPLTFVGLLMIPALAASLAGIWLDPRVITGAPAWLKPAKFAASIGIYTLTLAWIFTYLPEWRRTRRVVGWTTAVVMVLELAVIDLQAWRGTSSHFNVGTPLDMALFSIMGSAIVIQTLTSIAVAVALWRQSFADRAIGWALRLGFTLTIVGAAAGGLMTRPTQAQLDDARLTKRMVVAGAHTVGAPDGGSGLPGTGWSREHGDLRVPHFVGLHAVQAITIVAFLMRRRIAMDAARARIIVLAGASYGALYVILLWQALRGQSIAGPDLATMTAMALWAIGTMAAGWMLTRGLPRLLAARMLSAH